MRVIVCGGRDFSDARAGYAFLDEQHAELRFTHVASGVDEKNPEGADKIAMDWAAERGIPFRGYAADWGDLSHPDALIRTRRDGTQYDAVAGPRRNRRMFHEVLPQRVLAMPGGRGTRDMCAVARSHGVEVIKL